MNNKNKIMRFVKDLNVINSNDYASEFQSNAAKLLEQHRIDTKDIAKILVAMLHFNQRFTNACLQEFAISLEQNQKQSNKNCWLEFFASINISKTQLYKEVESVLLPALDLPKGINQIF
jgi:hypothetical protein